MNIYNHYNKHGFTVVKNFFSKKDIGLLKIKIENFIKKNQKKFNKKRGDINFNKDKINSIHTLHRSKKEFEFIYKNKKLKRLLKKILSPQNSLRAMELFAKPAKFGMPSPMHQDNYLWNIKNGKGLTVWVCLDTSNKKNGGISYLPNSHRYGTLDHEPSFAPGTSQAIKKKILRKITTKNKVVTPNLFSGDICVHSCLTVHGSNKNTSKNPRRGFTLQFKDKYAKYDREKILAYRQSLKKQISLRSKI